MVRCSGRDGVWRGAGEVAAEPLDTLTNTHPRQRLVVAQGGDERLQRSM